MPFHLGLSPPALAHRFIDPQPSTLVRKPRAGPVPVPGSMFESRIREASQTPSDSEKEARACRSGSSPGLGRAFNKMVHLQNWGVGLWYVETIIMYTFLLGWWQLWVNNHGVLLQKEKNHGTLKPALLEHFGTPFTCPTFGLLTS